MAPPVPSQPSQMAALPYPSAPSSSSAYPGLAEYMGLELTEDIIRANMPEYLPTNQQVSSTNTNFPKRRPFFKTFF